MKRYERTRALVEGNSALVCEIVEEIESEQEKPVVLGGPQEELVMVQVRETAQGSLFYLGEALMTSCRVRVGSSVGLGMVLGSNHRLAYELAVVDAAFSGEQGAFYAERWDSLLHEELALIEKREELELRRSAMTRVDFSTMEVEA